MERIISQGLLEEYTIFRRALEELLKLAGPKLFWEKFVECNIFMKKNVDRKIYKKNIRKTNTFRRKYILIIIF